MTPMNNRLLRPASNYDADALRYIDAVQVADGQALEPEVRTAIDAFVRGCKSDGIWSAIKASCIMAGARTISGALVPLAGDAPTPYNFTASDYSRTTGIKGDGSTTHLDTNRANDADGQNDRHWAIYSSDQLSNSDCSFGCDVPASYSSTQYRSGLANYFFCSSPNTAAASAVIIANSGAAGFHAASRNSSASFLARSAGTDASANISSGLPTQDNAYVFARNLAGSGASLHSASRLAFYSIGSSLDLAALDARVSTLISSIAAALS